MRVMNVCVREREIFFYFEDVFECDILDGSGKAGEKKNEWMCVWSVAVASIVLMSRCH